MITLQLNEIQYEAVLLAISHCSKWRDFDSPYYEGWTREQLNSYEDRMRRRGAILNELKESLRIREVSANGK